MAVSNQAPSSPENIITLDRRRSDRRDENQAESNAGTVQEPRRKKQRRRHIDPTTCERDYSDQEIEFMRAMDDYKRSSGRMFPTCSEVLEVIRALGYFQLSDDQADQLGLLAAEATPDVDSQSESLHDEFDAEL